MSFSTRDADNDKRATSCAVSCRGAWWYRTCHYSNLNGAYLSGAHSSIADGVNWYHWKGYYYSVRRTEMKTRQVSPPPYPAFMRPSIHTEGGGGGVGVGGRRREGGYVPALVRSRSTGQQNTRLDKSSNNTDLTTVELLHEGNLSGKRLLVLSCCFHSLNQASNQSISRPTINPLINKTLNQ